MAKYDSAQSQRKCQESDIKMLQFFGLFHSNQDNYSLSKDSSLYVCVHTVVREYGFMFGCTLYVSSLWFILYVRVHGCMNTSILCYLWAKVCTFEAIEY